MLKTFSAICFPTVYCRCIDSPCNCRTSIRWEPPASLFEDLQALQEFKTMRNFESRMSKTPITFESWGDDGCHWLSLHGTPLPVVLIRIYIFVYTWGWFDLVEYFNSVCSEMIRWDVSITPPRTRNWQIISSSRPRIYNPRDYGPECQLKSIGLAPPCFVPSTTHQIQSL